MNIVSIYGSECSKISWYAEKFSEITKLPLIRYEDVKIYQMTNPLYDKIKNLPRRRRQKLKP